MTFPPQKFSIGSMFLGSIEATPCVFFGGLGWGIGAFCLSFYLVGQMTREQT